MMYLSLFLNKLGESCLLIMSHFHTHQRPPFDYFGVWLLCSCVSHAASFLCYTLPQLSTSFYLVNSSLHTDSRFEVHLERKRCSLRRPSAGARLLFQAPDCIQVVVGRALNPLLRLPPTFKNLRVISYLSPPADVSSIHGGCFLASEKNASIFPQRSHLQFVCETGYNSPRSRILIPVLEKRAESQQFAFWQNPGQDSLRSRHGLVSYE